MCAYHVTLAVGNARRHDTGQRIRVDVLAASPLDAAVLAERSTDAVIGDCQYCYAKSVQPMTAPPVNALALAA